MELLIYLFTEQRPIKDHKHVARICGIDPRTSARLWAKIGEKFALNQHGSTHELVTKILNNSGRIKGLDSGAYGGGVPAPGIGIETGIKEKSNTRVKTAPQSTPNPDDAIQPEDTPKPPKREPCPYTKILELYHDTLPELPAVVKLTDARKRAIKARWSNGMYGVGEWEAYFADIRSSRFLMGKVDPPPGRKQFIADIDFLIRESTIIKMQEGKYTR